MNIIIDCCFSILKVKESGIFNQWIGAEILNTTQCMRPPSSDSSARSPALGITDLLGALCIIAIGRIHIIPLYIGVIHIYILIFRYL